ARLRPRLRYLEFQGNCAISVRDRPGGNRHQRGWKTARRGERRCGNGDDPRREKRQDNRHAGHRDGAGRRRDQRLENVRDGGVELTRDGRRLYAACGISNVVSVIDTASLKVIANIKAGDGPWGVVTSSDQAVSKR